MADWHCGVCGEGWDQDDSSCNNPTCYQKGVARWLKETPGSLNELGAEILLINHANGWNVTRRWDWTEDDDVYKIPAVLALIHSEVSEALEAYRAKDLENFREELADVLIRVLDCAAGLGIDMDVEVTRKLDKNRTRGYRHGGKRV